MYLFEDVRFGLRTLVNNLAFTTVAVIAIALGIGVNATVFTITNAVLVKSLPVEKSDQVLYIMTRNSLRNNQRSGVSYPDFRDWRAQAKSFTSMGAVEGPLRMNVADSNNPPEPYLGSRVTANTFPLLGIKPIAGRDFTAADEGAGATPVAIQIGRAHV